MSYTGPLIKVEFSQFVYIFSKQGRIEILWDKDKNIHTRTNPTVSFSTFTSELLFSVGSTGFCAGCSEIHNGCHWWKVSLLEFHCAFFPLMLNSKALKGLQNKGGPQTLDQNNIKTTKIQLTDCVQTLNLFLLILISDIIRRGRIMTSFTTNLCPIWTCWRESKV